MRAWLLLIAAGCAASPSAPADCTEENWQTCETRPTLDQLSVAWPQGRASVASLADAAAAAGADWHAWNQRVALQGADPSVILTSTGEFSAEAIIERDRAMSEASADIESCTQVLLGSGSPPWAAVSEFVQSCAEKMYAGALDLQAPELFQDAFGQPEPRSRMFGYLRSTTEAFGFMNLGGLPADAQAIATATAFVEARIADWTAMQETRLAGHSAADIQAAIDALGADDLRRITAFWATQSR